MAKNNNVIEEIQELIQQIKADYQEGADFEFVTPNLIKKASKGVHIKILSPRVKKFCREKFNFPHGIDNLDYEKGDQEGTDFYYRVNANNSNDDWDILDYAEGKLYRFNHDKSNSKKCKSCGKLTSYESGQMAEWSGRKLRMGSNPNIIAYFHPECAKKYFAGKEQPQENNNSRIKEKLLRNLDKICLDPFGYLANNEYLKTDGAEEEYQKAFNSPHQKEWKNRYLKIIIDGEEIDLENWDNSCPEYYEVKRELVKKIIQEIRKNPSEWKIEWGKNENYSKKSLNQLVKHQPSGRRYWKLAINHYWGGNTSEIKKYWPEIEALINGSPLPVNNSKLTNTELAKLKIIFQKLNIKKITFENGELIIVHNNNNETISNSQLTNNSEYQTLKEYCQKNYESEITKEQLGIKSDTNNSTNLKPNNHQLAIGLTIGASVVLVVGMVVYLIRKRNKKAV